MRTIVAIFLAATISFTAPGQDGPGLPRELQLILKYAQNHDYPEVFNDKPYQIRPIDWQIVDIDNDGVMEVFLQSFPHYRQSPTITVYQISSNDTVTRVIEGLAPGPLIPIDGDDAYFDTHTTGTGIDLQIGNSDYNKMRAFAVASLKFHRSTVLYKNFIHTDGRKGKPTFLDLAYLDVQNENSCKNFQFSKPSAIVTGRVAGRKETCFLALVGNEIYCYAIRGFSSEGWIDKELTIVKKPVDFRSFIVHDGLIKYVTKAGKRKELEL